MAVLHHHFSPRATCALSVNLPSVRAARTAPEESLHVQRRTAEHQFGDGIEMNGASEYQLKRIGAVPQA